MLCDEAASRRIEPLVVDPYLDAIVEAAESGAESRSFFFMLLTSSATRSSERLESLWSSWTHLSRALREPGKRIGRNHATTLDRAGSRPAQEYGRSCSELED